MQPVLEIKGITIGSGAPVVCVSITAPDLQGIVREAKELIDKNVKMIEWRADCFSQVEDPEAVKRALDTLKPFFDETVFVFTIRTKDQGGNAQLPEKHILYLQEIAAKSGFVDFVDVELFELTKPEKAIRRIHAFGAKVITSHHDFAKTPDEVVLHMLFDHMYLSDTDIGKVAMMPQTPDDVVRLIKLMSDTREVYPKMPIIIIGMGGLGLITRICGETFGSCVTFGALGAGSAPGQMEVTQLQDVLGLLHDRMAQD